MTLYRIRRTGENSKDLCYYSIMLAPPLLLSFDAGRQWRWFNVSFSTLNIKSDFFFIEEIILHESKDPSRQYYIQGNVPAMFLYFGSQWILRQFFKKHSAIRQHPLTVGTVGWIFLDLTQLNILTHTYPYIPFWFRPCPEEQVNHVIIRLPLTLLSSCRTRRQCQSYLSRSTVTGFQATGSSSLTRVHRLSC